MLQFRLLPLMIIVLLPKKSVVAYPHLKPRQFDTFWNNNVDWGKVGAGFAAAGGAIGTYLHLQPYSQHDTTTTTTPTGVPGIIALPGSPSSEINYELGNPIQGEPAKRPKRPSHEPSLPPTQCGMANIFSTDCGKILNQLVFTTGCSTIARGQVPTAMAIAQNGAILSELNLMAPGRVQTSTSSLCGIFLFMVPLTAEQSRQVALMPGVFHVSSDIFFHASDGSMNDPQSQSGATEPAFKKRQLRKRDIVRQQEAPAHLQFLSTSENHRGISTDYVYDSTGGVNTVVFHAGPGLIMSHAEFKNNPITHGDFIFAADIDPDDTFLVGSDGTCVASLVMGGEVGVSKYAKLKPVRTSATVGSLITAMVKIANYINDRVTNPIPPINGFVMLMDMAWENTDLGTLKGFELVLGMLMYDYDVVTVVDTGFNKDGSYGQIDTFPAIYAQTFPVIAVGAVDMSGTRYSWSPGGDGLTVTAPGSAICASNDGGTIIGTGPSIAASQAAGLAAYFLALYPELRTGQKVKEFMATTSWARLPGGDKSIWNLMGPETLDPNGNGISPNSPY